MLGLAEVGAVVYGFQRLSRCFGAVKAAVHDRPVIALHRGYYGRTAADKRFQPLLQS